MRTVVPGEPEQADPLNAPEQVVDQCRRVWSLFKDFVLEAGRFAGATVLAVVHSHYPRINLKRIEEGVAADVDDDDAEKLRGSSLEAATKVMQQIKLVDEGSTSGSA